MSGVMEYRDDDVKGVGFCPQCRSVLGDVKLSGIAYCEEHGWVFVDWGQLPSEEERNDER